MVIVNTYVKFEVMDIIVDKYPYPTLFGVDWALDIYSINYLK